MWKKIRFFIKHSINDLRKNGRRTIFALLCIASGVAVIVSLQTLGVMVSETLKSNLQETLCGDLQIDPVADSEVSADIARAGQERGLVENALIGKSFGPDSGDSFSFTQKGLSELTEWFNERYPGSAVTYRRTIAADDHGPAPSTITDINTDTQTDFVASFLIDANTYPLYGTRLTETGEELNTLLRSPTDIVISDTLAKLLGAQVGDTLRLNYVGKDLTLRGVIATESEGGFENVFGSVFGFYYGDLQMADLFEGRYPKADQVYVKLADPSQVSEAATAFSEEYPFFSTMSTVDLELDNSQMTKLFYQLITIIGLVALMLGGIGIMNTMRVVISRRTREIAILKTLGLQGNQISLLFIVESLLMGIIGSLAGIMAGWLLAYLLKGLSSIVSVQPIGFKITFPPVRNGFCVGILMTVIFGFLPTLTAAQIRPNLILQPSDTLVPKVKTSKSLAVVLGMLVVIGIIAQTLIGDLLDIPEIRLFSRIALSLLGGGIALCFCFSGLVSRQVGIALVPALMLAGFALGQLIPAILIILAIFLLTGALYIMVWSLLWAVGRYFPAFRIAEMRLALRSLSASVKKGANTMLVLAMSMIFLSFLSLLSGGATAQLRQMLVNEAGGNVMVWYAAGETPVEKVENIIANAEGVRSFSMGNVYELEYVSYYDVSEDKTIPWENTRVPGAHGWPLGETQAHVDARIVDANLPQPVFYKGRQLTPDDADKPYVVITANASTLQAGFDIGDRLNFRIVSALEERPMISLEIVGMIDHTKELLDLAVTSQNYAPLGVFPTSIPPENTGVIIDIDPGQIQALKQNLSDFPGVFVLEINSLNAVISKFIARFSSLPILITLLALLVGGIVIANSAALSSQDRRREFAIMKAVGLPRRRILGMLVMEYGIMGLLSGIIGTAIGSIAGSLVVTNVFRGAVSPLPVFISLGLVLLSVLIAVAAAVVSTGRATAEKPLSVLRYE